MPVFGFTLLGLLGACARGFPMAIWSSMFGSKELLLLLAVGALHAAFSVEHADAADVPRSALHLSAVFAVVRFMIALPGTFGVRFSSLLLGPMQHHNYHVDDPAGLREFVAPRAFPSMLASKDLKLRHFDR